MFLIYIIETPIPRVYSEIGMVLKKGNTDYSIGDDRYNGFARCTFIEWIIYIYIYQLRLQSQ